MRVQRKFAAAVVIVCLTFSAGPAAADQEPVIGTASGAGQMAFGSSHSSSCSASNPGPSVEQGAWNVYTANLLLTVNTTWEGHLALCGAVEVIAENFPIGGPCGPLKSSGGFGRLGTLDLYDVAFEMLPVMGGGTPTVMEITARWHRADDDRSGSMSILMQIDVLSPTPCQTNLETAVATATWQSD